MSGAERSVSRVDSRLGAIAGVVLAGCGGAPSRVEPRAVEDDLVEIAAQTVVLGSPEGEEGRDEDEGPLTEIALERFWVDRTPVTVAQLEAHLGEVLAADPAARVVREDETPSEWVGGCNVGSARRDHPATCVNVEAARAFCGLRGMDLPTEAEREAFARGGTRTAYAWGDSFDETRAVSSVACGARGCRGSTQAVVTSGPRCNALGVCDAAGNVWEWTITEYAPSHGVRDDRATPGTGRRAPRRRRREPHRAARDSRRVVARSRAAPLPQRDARPRLPRARPHTHRIPLRAAGLSARYSRARMSDTSTKDAPDVALGSTDRFGYEWKNYAQIIPEHERQLGRWMGSTGLASFEGKRCLDVGCGMGRNPFFMLKNGAKEMVAVDVDDGSLDAARRNLGGDPRATVKKCSVYDLDPKELGTFDRVTNIGVLHHLAEPERALEKMWAMVAPGGDLCLWCYGKNGNELILPVIQAFRFVGSRLPIGATHAVAKVTTAVAWPVMKRIPFRTEYYNHLKTLSKKNVESIIFDQMLPHIAHYWTRTDMEKLVQPLGGDATIELVQGNSWHVRVVKRAG